MRTWLPVCVVAAAFFSLATGCASVTDDPAPSDADESPQAPAPPPSTSPSSPASPAAGDTNPVPASSAAPAQDPYAHLDPTHVIAKKLLDQATAYFDANKAQFPNKDFIAIVDFSLHSGKQRFFVVDMKTGAVKSYVVAHGSGSDPDSTGWAKTFSNIPGSYMSSLGFAVTADIFYGAHGRSLTVKGLSDTNSNLLSREVIIHGADYVSEGRTKQGRSEGCWALPMPEKDSVIDNLQGGAMLYSDLGSGIGGETE